MSNITGSFYTSNSNLENLIPSQADIADITQRITGITYDSITDTTNIDNNVTITSPHILTLNGIDVYSTISGFDTRIVNLETTTTGISYVSGTDTTTIANNVVIPAGKTLTLNGGDVDAQLTALEDKTVGITYDFTFDTTTIDNNVTIPVGKILTLNGSNVATQISTLNTKTSG